MLETLGTELRTQFWRNSSDGRVLLTSRFLVSYQSGRWSLASQCGRGESSGAINIQLTSSSSNFSTSNTYFIKIARLTITETIASCCHKIIIFHHFQQQHKQILILLVLRQTLWNYNFVNCTKPKFGLITLNHLDDTFRSHLFACNFFHRHLNSYVCAVFFLFLHL